AYELARMMNLETDNGNISNIMEKLGLEAEILHRSFSKISGGQKQRAIIAICLALNKEVVLMDEPTASLDDKSIKLLINTIKELKGTTIVSASHNKLWHQGADQIFEI
ncbi:MAG: ATP-binding cassette domain-containing protein, partial [Bacteroidales bacterium]